VQAVSLQNLSLVLAWLGRLEEGRAVAKRSVALFGAQSDVRMLAASLCYLGRIELQLGMADEAQRNVRAALEASGEHPPVRAQALSGLAAIELATGRAEDALEHARQAKAILDSPTGVEEGHVLIRLVHAEALRGTGDLAAAGAAIDEAKERLLESAQKISDPTLAHSFLDNVPENARTLELARKWLGPDATLAT
jgi:tetratricopeptide (TPR) repeat protein